MNYNKLSCNVLLQALHGLQTKIYSPGDLEDPPFLETFSGVFVHPDDNDIYFLLSYSTDEYGYKFDPQDAIFIKLSDIPIELLDQAFTPGASRIYPDPTLSTD